MDAYHHPPHPPHPPHPHLCHFPHMSAQSPDQHQVSWACAELPYVDHLVGTGIRKYVPESESRKLEIVNQTGRRK